MATLEINGVSWLLIAVIVLIVFLIAVIVLYIEEKKIKKRIALIRNDRTIFYKKRIRSLKQSKKTPEQNLVELNSLSRSFFKEAFKINPKLDYSEIINKLKDKKEYQEFWKNIVEYSYSGKKVAKKDVDKLISVLEKLIETRKL